MGKFAVAPGRWSEEDVGRKAEHVAGLGKAKDTVTPDNIRKGHNDNDKYRLKF